MALATVNAGMQQRRGTAAQWSTVNPVLAEGEIGFETDTLIIKVGDGVTHWSDLKSGYVRRNGRDIIQAADRNTVPGRFQGVATQAVDLAQFLDVNGNVLSRVGPDGKIYEGASKYLTTAEAVAGYEPRLNRTGMTAGMVPQLQADGVTMQLAPNPASKIFDVNTYSLNNWTYRNVVSGSTYVFTKVIWVQQLGLFVAGYHPYTGTGPYSSVFTSPDGLNWTVRTTTTRGISGLVYAPEISKILACSPQNSSNSFLYSSDGITWTNPSISSTVVPYQLWRSIAWSSSLRKAVAVSDSTTAGGGTAATSYGIITSNDGTTWTPVQQPVAGQWKSIVWSSDLNLFVAVGVANGCMTSPDGTTWTVRTIPTGTWTAVEYSSSLKLFVVLSTTGAIVTSPDGITWTTRTPLTLPANSGTWNSVIWISDLSRFIAVGTGVTSTSADGINWIYVPVAFNNWITVAWNPVTRQALAMSSDNPGNGQTMASLFIPPNYGLLAPGAVTS